MHKMRRDFRLSDWSFTMDAYAVWAIFHSNQWSTTDPSKVVLSCCPVCGKAHIIKDPLLLIGKSSQCGDSGFPLKKYVTMTTCLTPNSRWYKDQCITTDCQVTILRWPEDQCCDADKCHTQMNKQFITTTTTTKMRRANGTEWAIRSWCWWSGFTVGQHYKVTISAHCHKLVPILIWP